MSKSFPVRHALSAAVLALFLTGAATETFAQSASDAFNVGRKGRKAEKEARQEKAQAKAEAKYPEATREEPEAKASAKLSKDLKKIFDAYEADDAASVVPLADEMIANEKANAYERSISARLAAASLIGEDDAKAMAYLQKALEFNGLSNNEHYDSMLMLGQLQLQTDNDRLEEHTTEHQSLMRISYAVFCLKKKTKSNKIYVKIIILPNIMNTR